MNDDIVGRIIASSVVPLASAPATPAHTRDQLALGLSAELRRAGWQLPVGRILQLAAALDELAADPRSPGSPSSPKAVSGGSALGEVSGGSVARATLYWAGRATLLSNPAQIEGYDRAFAAFWDGLAPARPDAVSVPLMVAMANDGDEAPDGSEGPDPDDDAADTVVVARYSDREIVRHKDLARCTDDELAEAYRLMGEVRLLGSPQRSRRRRRSRRAGAPLDLGRTVHDALGTAGEVLHRRTSVRTTRPRRVVILADISGSMDPYARAVLRFAQAAVAGRRRVEAFTLGTRLTRVTRELDAHDPDVGIARAMAVVEDWSGGTRLGDNLGRFNDEWGVAGLARGAVVVIVSDGWDQGDPVQLGDEMARLSRVAFRVVWVNPLKASDGYEPLARGMAAALPHVDRFVEGHSLAALDDLVQVIAS